MKSYDLIVIGAGAAGLNCSLIANELGLKVLLLNKTSTFGGDCTNVGCVPSKSLLHIAKVCSYAKQSELYGLKISGNVSMEAIRSKLERTITSFHKDESPEVLKKMGLDVAIGTARFVADRVVECDSKQYFGRKIIIATGSVPFVPPLKGLEKVSYETNETIFSKNKMPKNMLIVGGGPIGVEMAQAWSRLGVSVTLVNKEQHLLKNKDCGHVIQRVLETGGVKVCCSDEVVEFLSSSKALLKSGTQISFDTLLIATGRKIVVDSLHPSSSGIKTTKKGLVVNNYLQTTNKHVYACGDVAGGVMFTHGAELHARIIINNILNPLKKKVDTKYFSWVTFTSPEVAVFGLSEEELKNKNISYEVYETPLERSDRFRIEDSTTGFHKVFVSKNRILGGVIVSDYAGEIMQELILGMQENISFSSLLKKIYAYPVASRINQWPSIIRARKKVTPIVKKLISWWFRV